jgi:hypothetical protein
MNAKIFKIMGMFFVAALVMTGCAHDQKAASAVSDEDAVATMEEIAGIVMSGPVGVESIVANDPGAAFTIANSASAEAVITSINAATRIIVVQTQDGNTKSFTAGPAVKNFDKLKVGDTITVTYTESMAVYLGQDGAPSADMASGLARKSDGTPGAALFGEAQVTAKVLALDKATRLVKLELPENDVREFTIRDGVNLSKVNVGDSVTVAIARALVIGVAH